MAANSNIEDQNSLWVALARRYLDTELQEQDFKFLAERILESPFSYEEVREIDRKEVFPVLYPNLLNATGFWDGFDKEWLVASILKKKGKRNFLTRKYYNLLYFCMNGMFREGWQEIELALKKYGRGTAEQE